MDDIIYFYICANCGSFRWEEYYDWASIGFVIHEDGDIKETSKGYGTLTGQRCLECDQYNSIHQQLFMDRSEWKKLYNMDGRDRLIYLIQLMAEKRIEFDKEFVDDVIEYHKNDGEFMEKISDYLQTLGYTTKMTWIKGD